MERYADVIVDIVQSSLDRTFQYRIPRELYEKVQIGCRVCIPFGGGGRQTDGYVIGVGTVPKLEPDKIKEILRVMPDQVNAASGLIRLAFWMRKNYGSTMIQALKTVLPVRTRKKPKEEKKIYLAVSAEEAEKALEQCEKKHYRAKSRLLRTLLQQDYLLQKEAVEQKKIPRDTLRRMEEDGLIRIEKRTVLRGMDNSCFSAESGCTRNYPLTEEQLAVCTGIFHEWETEKRPCLIRGVTGSGKTLVYMALIEEMLKRNRQVIVLIPEIALSWQMVERFRKRFGNMVAVQHSRMSEGERSDQYRLAESGEAKIAIGPRSALFMPFSRLGLILIDEEQEDSYRSEQAPRYDAREAALERARLDGAYVVFGSATPSLDSYYACREGRYALFSLDHRYGGAALPQVKIVDMRKELREGNRSVLSRPLQEAVADRLNRGEQTILFLNQRGFSAFVSCRSCGEVIRCPHCDVSLTYHSGGKMVCHYCGYTIPAVHTCPSCGSPYIGGLRAGTEKVADEVSRLFPSARILRMDADTTKRKDMHGKILRSFAAQEADILVGTQMIIKGHDFPAVTLVGILAADMSLFASDYRAPEKTFQLLVQAIGRAGRGKLPGEAIIQTYHPDHYCLKAAAVQDYDRFYKEEIFSRQMMGYPPACHMLAVHGACRSEEKLCMAMAYVRKYLQSVAGKESTVLIGPAPERISRVQDMYRYVLYMKEPDRQEIIRARELLEQYIRINSGFRETYMQYDLDV